jgi:uncharacterized protein (TIGR03435 family)
MSQPLDRYIFQAYGLYGNDKVDRYQVSTTLPDVEGGSRWIHSDLFEIIAKTDQSTDMGLVDGAMMRTLLEEQFQLKVHSEPRPVPVYELIAKGNFRLPPARIGCVTPQDMPVSDDPGAPASPSCFAGRIDRTDLLFWARPWLISAM